MIDFIIETEEFEIILKYFEFFLKLSKGSTSLFIIFPGASNQEVEDIYYEIMQEAGLMRTVA